MGWRSRKYVDNYSVDGDYFECFIALKADEESASQHQGRHFLQIPGPSPVPDRVLRAMDMPVIDHRSPEFAEIGKAVFDGCQKAFKTVMGRLVRGEMGLSAAGVPRRGGGVDAAMKAFEESVRQCPRGD
jgi:hypothetical protein